METLTIPEGCIFEGEITSLCNSGDISIISSLVPARLESLEGNIHYKAGAATTACEEVSAPNGNIVIEAAALVVEKLVSQSAEIRASECELADTQIAGILSLSADDLVLGQVVAESAVISGDTIKADSITVTGELRIEANLCVVKHISAGKLVMQGSLDCKRLEVAESAAVESGNVAIKRLEGPSFYAAPEVTGIVVVSLCPDVKAQGVRGFLHPSELGLLTDAAGVGAVAPAAPKAEEAPKEPALKREPEPVQTPDQELTPEPAPELEPETASEPEPEPASEPEPVMALHSDSMDDVSVEVAPDNEIYSVDLDELPEPEREEMYSVNLDDGVSTEDLDDVDLTDDDDFAAVEEPVSDALSESLAASAFEEEPVAFDDEPIEESFATRDVSQLPLLQDNRLSSGEFDTVALDPGAIKALNDVLVAEDIEELPAAEDLDLPDELEQINSEELEYEVEDGLDGDTAPDGEDVAAESVAASDDFGLPELSPQGLPEFDADDLISEELTSEDLDADVLNADDLDDLSSTFDQLDTEEAPVNADQGAALDDGFGEVDGLPEVVDDFGDIDTDVPLHVADSFPMAEELPEVEVDFGHDELGDDNLPEVGNGFEDLDEPLLDDLDELLPDDMDASLPDDDTPADLVTSLDDPLSGELEEEAIEPVAELDAYSGAVEDVFSANPLDEEIADGDDLEELVHVSGMDDDDDEFANIGEEFGDDVFAEEVEAENPEDVVIAQLTSVMEQIRAYFPEDNYPSPINQIMRYLDERRLTVFFKESNRAAVLSNFDKFNHTEISSLVRVFFDYVSEYRQLNT